MVLVLALFMLVVGGGIAALYFNQDETRLNGAVGEIELLAKRARSLATLQQRPFALEFTKDGVALIPYGEAALDLRLRETLMERGVLGADEEGPAFSEGKKNDWQIEPGMRLLVRRWATGEWEELKRDEHHVWRFDPQGICEPVGVRIELENGSWIAALFHPLTAGIHEIESEIS
jgi:hypothetical protein